MGRIRAAFKFQATANRRQNHLVPNKTKVTTGRGPYAATTLGMDEALRQLDSGRVFTEGAFLLGSLFASGKSETPRLTRLFTHFSQLWKALKNLIHHRFVGGLEILTPRALLRRKNSEKNFGQMKGGFEPATLESQVEHSTTEPKPLLSAQLIWWFLSLCVKVCCQRCLRRGKI